MIKRYFIRLLFILLILSSFFLVFFQGSINDIPLRIDFLTEELNKQKYKIGESISIGLQKILGKGSFGTIYPNNGTLLLSRDDVNASLLCPFPPPNLRGRQEITFNSIPHLSKLKVNNEDAFHQGVYSPPDCVARQRVAIIIPYRDREQHLSTLLHYLHPFLQRQKIEYGIYIIEQNGGLPFNRGILLNIGFVEALKIQKYDCFIFHDVDLIPEDDRNFYMCHIQPRHASVAVSTFRYKIPYTSLFGGVTALSPHHFQKINGYSNLFWGWGGEDDDISWRISSNDFHVFRYPKEIARYTMMSHEKEIPNEKRFKFLYEKEALFKNGLSTLEYKVKERKRETSYIRLLVDVKK